MRQDCYLIVIHIRSSINNQIHSSINLLIIDSSRVSVVFVASFVFAIIITINHSHKGEKSKCDHWLHVVWCVESQETVRSVVLVLAYIYALMVSEEWTPWWPQTLMSLDRPLLSLSGIIKSYTKMNIAEHRYKVNDVKPKQHFSHPLCIMFYYWCTVFLDQIWIFLWFRISPFHLINVVKIGYMYSDKMEHVCTCAQLIQLKSVEQKSVCKSL